MKEKPLYLDPIKHHKGIFLGNFPYPPYCKNCSVYIHPYDRLMIVHQYGYSYEVMSEFMRYGSHIKITEAIKNSKYKTLL